MEISVRELKSRLSETLRRVTDGEEVVVTSRGKEVARFALAAENVAVFREALDDLERVRVLLAQPRVLRGLAEDGGIGERARELVRALFDLAQLIEQHRGSAPPCKRPWTAASEGQKKTPAGARATGPAGVTKR